MLLLIWICAEHDEGGAKGRSIPLPNVFACIGISAIAACACRLLSRIATPFVSGIAGVFGLMNVVDGPYGGVIGILVGALVALWPATNRGARSPKEHAR